MINIGFWNTGLHPKTITQEKTQIVNEHIASIAQENSLDIFAVCEYPVSSANLLIDDRMWDAQFEEAGIVNRTETKILYSKRSVYCFPEISIDHSDHVMNRFRSSGLEFNLACVHLPSKCHASDEKRKACAAKILKDIAPYEKDNRKTIIVGDFNADPHEETMMSILGFHALPDRDVAVGGRTVEDEYYQSFYNPMWNLYGDMLKPTGTHFYDNSDAVNQYWYLIDQVIMRHDVIPYFINESLSIISAGLGNKNGKPNISDHFPIVFSLR